jgi:protein ImuA
LIVVEARSPREVLWALEEGLRSTALAGVVGEVAACDLTASRRLQLAAERAGSIALLLRIGGDAGGGGAGTGSAAVSRWQIAAASGAEQIAAASGAEQIAAIGGGGGGERTAFDVALLKCRGGGAAISGRVGGGGRWRLEWDDAALCFHLVAVLADRPACLRRSEAPASRRQAAPRHINA